MDAGVDDGADVILGDNGRAFFNAIDILVEIKTADPTEVTPGNFVDYGDADVLLAGNGSDVVLGGSGGDTIDAGTDTGRDVAVGDQGEAIFDDAGRLISITTMQPDWGGDDAIRVGNGDDVVLGGFGADDIDAGADSGRDIVVGDNGFALFDLVDVNAQTRSVLRQIQTTDPQLGGSDYVRAGDGDDVVLGGSGTDYLSVDRNGVNLDDDSGNDVMLGDNGQAVFDTSTGRSIPQQITTTDPTTVNGTTTDWGAADYIFAAGGSDVVLGGSGGDRIDAGTDLGDDIVVGDQGTANFSPNGILISITTQHPDWGGDDRIVVGDGDDVVLGGFGSDHINVDPDTGQPVGVDSGHDVIVGDNGVAQFDVVGDAPLLRQIETTDPLASAGDFVLPATGPMWCWAAEERMTSMLDSTPVATLLSATTDAPNSATRDCYSGSRPRAPSWVMPTESW